MCGCLSTASRSTFPSHTQALQHPPFTPAPLFHPPQWCRWAGCTWTPQPPSLAGLSVIFCPRQDIAHLPSSVGMGVHGRSHHLPHVRSTASIKDEFLCQSIPIPSSIPLCPNYFIWGAWISPESTILGRTWVPLRWQPQQTYAFVLRVSYVLCIHPFSPKALYIWCAWKTNHPEAFARAITHLTPIFLHCTQLYLMLHVEMLIEAVLTFGYLALWRPAHSYS